MRKSSGCLRIPLHRSIKLFKQPENIIDAWLLELLKKRLEDRRPDVVGITIPFPGKSLCRLKMRSIYQEELCAHQSNRRRRVCQIRSCASFQSQRSLTIVDFITLDDGELPFLNILKFLEGEKNGANLKRTFLRSNGEVQYRNNAGEKDFSHAETGCPDYSDLLPDRYLSLIEIANPMHRLWSDGRWNKLAVAHGCYWHQCSFCDTSLDYICRYDTIPAPLLVDRIEQVMAQTGQTGFHFIDEAAPPAMLKELALELLRRRISISWWANIRFENVFTEDLCRLLAASGCIAATGGLETASDRLLKLMNKGVTVRQAAQVCRNFSEAGIMVHAYLMYGFPTQTAEETIDSLEIVRQFFKEGLIQSAFWHLFTATVHSDVGRNPQKYHIRIVDFPSGGFAKNDLVHEDPAGCDHHAFAPGLNKAVYNFMHGIGTDFPVKNWFDFKVPSVSAKRNYIEQATSDSPAPDNQQMKSRLLWIENLPQYEKDATSAGKGKQAGRSRFIFNNKTESFSLVTSFETGEWLNALFQRFSVRNTELLSLEELKNNYETRFATSFQPFLRSKEWKTLRENGLLLI